MKVRSEELFMNAKKSNSIIDWSTDGTYTGVNIYGSGVCVLDYWTRSNSSTFTLSKPSKKGTYQGEISRWRQPNINYWNIFCTLYYIDETSEIVWQETAFPPQYVYTNTVNFVAAKDFNKIVWSLNYNPSSATYCNGYVGYLTNWVRI